MAKKPIQCADDAENMHTIYKKEYVLHADLEKAQKLENSTGQELKTKKKEKIVFIFLTINSNLFYSYSNGG